MGTFRLGDLELPAPETWSWSGRSNWRQSGGYGTGIPELDYTGSDGYVMNRIEFLLDSDEAAGRLGDGPWEGVEADIAALWAMHLPGEDRAPAPVSFAYGTLTMDVVITALQIRSEMRAADQTVIRAMVTLSLREYLIGETEQRTPREERGLHVYIVGSDPSPGADGETFHSIAARADVYADERLWTVLRDYNPQFARTTSPILPVGLEVIVPDWATASEYLPAEKIVKAQR